MKSFETSSELDLSFLAPVLLVMGKGGVGKTTVAAGLAYAASSAEAPATLVEFGDGESGKRALLGSDRIVEHVVITPEQALEAGAAPLFGSALLAKVALGNFAMKPLLRAAPAIRELAMLEAVRVVAAQRPGRRIVVDMPATGHGVAWLRVPRQGRDFLGSGPLFELCDGLARNLLSQGRASIVVVTLPEALVIEETLELCLALQTETALSVQALVLNRQAGPVAQAALADALQWSQKGGAIGAAAQELLTILRSREQTREAQRTALAPLRASGCRFLSVTETVEAPLAQRVAAMLAELGEV